MKNTVIFDLDGTLIDTLFDLTDSVNYVLTENKMPKRTYDEIRSFVGNGIYRTIELAVPLNTPKELTDKCYKEMVEYYKTHSLIKTKPYEGVQELIKVLHDKKINTAVATNKTEPAAKDIVKMFFGENIDFVVGDDKKTPLKPNPDNIIKIFNHFNIKPEEVIYIGDSEVDVLTAKNSNLDMIAVLWGFRDKEILIENGASKFAQNTNELLSLLNSYFSHS